MACLFGHKWNGCKCEICGKTRDEGHDFRLVDDKCMEECAICGKTCNTEHAWVDCVCVQCGETRHKLENTLDRIHFAGVTGRGTEETFYVTIRRKCTECGKTFEQKDLLSSIHGGRCSAYRNGRCAPYGKDSGHACSAKPSEWSSCSVVGENLRFYKYWDYVVIPDAAQSVPGKSADSESALEQASRAAIEAFADQDDVMKFLRENKDALLQAAIIERLPDQATLATFAKLGVSNEVRCAAIQRLTDISALEEIVYIHPDAEVCTAAARKLPGQAGLDALEEIENRILRLTEVEKLSDQSRLAELALHYRYCEVRKAAADKLTDQAALAQIALHDRSSVVRKAAVVRLSDQTALAQIAVSDEKFISIRITAIEHLTDLAVLTKLASNDAEPLIRSAAQHALEELGVRLSIRKQEAPGMHANKEGTHMWMDSGAAKPVRYRDMGREEGVAYVNKMNATELMELILFGEDGQDAKDLVWLCSRLTAKMMVAHEVNNRAVIEMFFHVFGGAGALAQYRSITGFWNPNEAERAFTQLMLRFAGLPKSTRDVHKNLYAENYRKR